MCTGRENGMYETSGKPHLLSNVQRNKFQHNLNPGQQIYVQDSALPLTCYAALRKLTHFSEPQFIHLDKTEIEENQQ